MRGEHGSGLVPPGWVQVGQAHRQRPTSCYLPGMEGDCDRRCATERAAGRRLDLAGPLRTYGISGETGHTRVQRFPAGGCPSRLAGC